MSASSLDDLTRRLGEIQGARVKPGSPVRAADELSPVNARISEISMCWCDVSDPAAEPW